jgi:hypothetical protein
MFGAILGAVAAPIVSSIFAPDSPSSGAGSASAAADPFAAQRAQYQPQLTSLMNSGDPSAAMLRPWYNFRTSDPSYAWRQQQGMDTLQRGLAQTGQTASGNEMAQLQQYGQGQASQEFANEFNRQQSVYGNQYSRLAQLSGALSGSPGIAGQLQANQNMQQQQAASALGNTIGGAAGNWLGNYMNTGDNSITPASGQAFPVTPAGYQFNSQPVLSGGTDLNAFAGYTFD